MTTHRVSILARRLMNFARSVGDLQVWLHVLRLLHFYGYAHVRERRRMDMGVGVRFSPTVSIRNGERVTIGSGSHIGERCSLWAGDSTGRIVIGQSVLFGPSVYITASNYDFDAGSPVMDQPKREADVVIGDDVWIGAATIVTPGVTIGSGCVVGAGSVVTKDLPPYSVAVGSPARVVRKRRRTDVRA